MKQERYSRQIMLPEIGEAGQRKLAEASVLIIGVGGLGSAVATYLTGAGVGRIGLMDHDTVSLSNLQRQVLYTEATVGLPKVTIAAERLKSQSSATRFDLYPEGLTPENGIGIISKYDIVIDCTDNYATRFLIDDTCSETGKPWVHGAIGAFRGQVSVFNYLRKCRYSDLYPDRETLCALPRGVNGVIGAVPGIIGTIQAAEAIKLIAGFGELLDGRLFTIDIKTLKTEIIDL